MSKRGALHAALRLWVAILAAWSLALAPVAASPAFAGGPAGAADLCSALGHADPDAPDRPAHDRSHPCCISGLSQSADAAPEPGALPPPKLSGVLAAAPAAMPDRPAASPERHPLAARGPPAATA